MIKIMNGKKEETTYPYHYSLFEELFDSSGEHIGYVRHWTMYSKFKHTDEEIIEMFTSGAENCLVEKDEEGSYEHYIVARDILDIINCELLEK